MSLKSWLHLSAYRFFKINDLFSLQENIKVLCLKHDIKGTVLLAPEGINLMVAGCAAAVRIFQETLPRFEPQLLGLKYKETVSDFMPFKRLKVKIKKEAIAFDETIQVDPNSPAPYLLPEALNQWIASGHPFTLLDTRNQCEIAKGTFKGARHLNLTRFRDFARSAKELLSEETKEKPIVTFCTGGIRCEKAALYLKQAGFLNVYQLKDGILGYFETCGSEFFEGECFVFDERVAIGCEH